MKTLVTVLFVLATALRVSAAPVNLVVNGDFSAGAVGFGTDYTQGCAVVAPECMWPDGVFTVAPSALGVHSLWEDGGDHTTGDGQFLLVNGRTDGPSTVWEETISTMPGWFYGFSLWGKNLCCAVGGAFVGPQLSFWINGLEFGSGFTDGPGVWQELSGGFQADTRVTRLEIRDAATNYSGNDFGLDDITVQPVPEPTTLLMLATGFTLIARRFRKA